MYHRILLASAIVLALACSSANATLVIDLTTAGATGTQTAVTGGSFTVQQVPDQSTGTGVIDSFVRIQSHGNEQGYNTSLGTPLDDKAPSGGFTRAITLGEIPTVLIGTELYRQFLLDINQDKAGTDPLLSLNQIQIFQAGSDMLHTGITDATASTNAIVQFTGATEVFRLNNLNLQANNDPTAGEVTTQIKLDYNLNPGSGAGDMYLYVKDSAFTQDSTSNVILFSQFGAPPGGSATNDGFEEWAVLQAGPVITSTPAPPTVLMLLSGISALGGVYLPSLVRSRRRTQHAA